MVPECGIVYDNFDVNGGWNLPNIQESVSSSQEYHGFWNADDDGGNGTILSRRFMLSDSANVQLYFTWIWGCSADEANSFFQGEPMGDRGIVSVQKVIDSTTNEFEYITSTITDPYTVLWPSYGYDDPLLIDPEEEFCDSSSYNPLQWREVGANIDGYLEFHAQENEEYVINFYGQMTTGGTDEFWGVTNVALVGHGCQRAIDSRITTTPTKNTPNPWQDDLVYDLIDRNGWSLPNLVLWNDANNGNRYHGMF